MLRRTSLSLTIWSHHMPRNILWKMLVAWQTCFPRNTGQADPLSNAWLMNLQRSSCESVSLSSVHVYLTWLYHLEPPSWRWLVSLVEGCAAHGLLLQQVRDDQASREKSSPKGRNIRKPIVSTEATAKLHPLQFHAYHPTRQVVESKSIHCVWYCRK